MKISAVSGLRLLVEITFHYNERRLPYLFQTIRGLCSFAVERLDIVVSTNVDAPSRLDRIRAMCSPLLASPGWTVAGRKTLAFESHPQLSDPWQLPWCHKPLISGRFLSAESDYTHFMHLEDDLLLSFDNLLYFVRYRELLRECGLIPAFVRIELDTASSEVRLVDSIGVSDYAARRHTRVDGLDFVNPDYPYQAMFVLDRELAAEYVRTPSFDRDASLQVRANWGLAERAAMGLCFESPPTGCTSRYAMPVQPDTLELPSWCWIHHLPNNYSSNPRSPHGKTAHGRLFGPRQAVSWSPPTVVDNLRWHVRELPKRLVFGQRDTGHGLVAKGLCALCGHTPSSARECARSGCPAPAKRND